VRRIRRRSPRAAVAVVVHRIRDGRPLRDICRVGKRHRRRHRRRPARERIARAADRRRAQRRRRLHGGRPCAARAPVGVKGDVVVLRRPLGVQRHIRRARRVGSPVGIRHAPVRACRPAGKIVARPRIRVGAERLRAVLGKYLVRHVPRPAIGVEFNDNIVFGNIDRRISPVDVKFIYPAAGVSVVIRIQCLRFSIADVNAVRSGCDKCVLMVVAEISALEVAVGRPGFVERLAAVRCRGTVRRGGIG